MKLKKILTISFCIIILLTHNVFALGDILSTGDNFLDTGYAHTDETMDTDNLKTELDAIYNILLSVATVVAIVVGAILGIKFMMSGVEKKVEVKAALFPYLISCIVVFGAVGIWKLTVTVIKEINPAPHTTITTTQSGGGITTQSSGGSTTQSSGGSTTQSSGGSTTHQSSSGRTHGGGGVSF